MRKILLIICILSVTLSARAQLFGKHYDEGAYYDLDNVKHTGLISWSPPAKSIFGGNGDQIYFKPEKKAEKIKLTNSQIKSFLVKKDSVTLDSFVVSANKEVAYSPFLQVVLNNAEIKLYSFLQTASAGGGMYGGASGAMMMQPYRSWGITDYYYGSNPNDVVKLTKKNFAEVMSKIMADKPLVVESINNKKMRLGLGKMDDVLFFYKNGYLPPPPPTENIDQTVAP
ncbi:hypothetical protein D0C36_18035 [Mucilaginibacter conchicola]|uniref:Uncharacterized protein n=1 Tax=Mucilaginibacter conchicola TaxID=2303333 RepID=A0A372NQC3_9SPHI|nr:hypothetical protein [Mucilaginibacter conchicola]RFZ90850.1 hypothetical protein D0C36_18035 [Mucilaginibacter conchicola]